MKKDFFETFFRINLLFLDKDFVSRQENQPILQLVNQILKKIISFIEVADFPSLTKEMPEKMKLIIGNLLK